MSAEIFHWGHVKFLQSVVEYFPKDSFRLTVLLATDQQITSFKNRKPIQSYEARKAVLASCSMIDVIESHPDVIDLPLVDRFDYLFHGDDLLQWEQEHFNKGMKLFLDQNKLILIPYTKDVSTSLLIKNMQGI